MSIATPMAGLTSLDHLFGLIETCNSRIQEHRGYSVHETDSGSSILRPLLADAVAKIAKLKWLVHKNTNAARSLRAELSEAKAENASLRRELIDVRAQAIRLRLSLFDADQRLPAGPIEGPPSIHVSSAPREGTAALIELKRIFAKRYHPNSASRPSDPRDRAIRTEIFKEFWDEIAAVETKYNKGRVGPETGTFP